jgi:hypothetical protein
MTTCNKVTWTRPVLGFLKQLARRANVLETVVFDNDRLSSKQPTEDRSHSGAGYMDNVSFLN